MNNKHGDGIFTVEQGRKILFQCPVREVEAMVNKMQEVATLLGVELNKPFSVKGLRGKWVLRETGSYWICDGEEKAHAKILIALLCGKFEIER